MRTTLLCLLALGLFACMAEAKRKHKSDKDNEGDETLLDESTIPDAEGEDGVDGKEESVEADKCDPHHWIRKLKLRILRRMKRSGGKKRLEKKLRKRAKKIMKKCRNKPTTEQGQVDNVEIENAHQNVIELAAVLEELRENVTLVQSAANDTRTAAQLYANTSIATAMTYNLINNVFLWDFNQVTPGACLGFLDQAFNISCLKSYTHAVFNQDVLPWQTAMFAAEDDYDETITAYHADVTNAEEMHASALAYYNELLAGSGKPSKCRRRLVRARLMLRLADHLKSNVLHYKKRMAMLRKLRNQHLDNNCEVPDQDTIEAILNGGVPAA